MKNSNDLKKYIAAFTEILFSSFNITFWVFDLIFYAVATTQKSVNLPSFFYIGVLVLGFLLSAVKKVVDKDRIIEALQEDIPTISLYLRDAQNSDGKRTKILRIRNLWSKPIKDIEIEPINRGNLFKLYFRIDDTNILKQDEERDLIHDSDTNIGKHLVFPSSFNPKYANADFDMKIKFKDMQNIRYEYVFNLGKSGIFVKNSKRIG